MTDVSHALDHRPILGEIARLWQRIRPGDLTVVEALNLLGVLSAITDRLDAEGTEIYPTGRGLSGDPSPVAFLPPKDFRQEGSTR